MKDFSGDKVFESPIKHDHNGLGALEIAVGYLESQNCIQSPKTPVSFNPSDDIPQPGELMATKGLLVLLSPCLNNKTESQSNVNHAEEDVGGETKQSNVNHAEEDVESIIVHLGRELKVSKYRQDPFIVQPDSTEQKPKPRARIKKLKKLRVPLISSDNEEIPEWTEDFSRPKAATVFRTHVPQYIFDVICYQKNKAFYFPWGGKSEIVKTNFWESIFGLGHHRKGWMSDTHIELWVLYLWHYRPADADYVMAGPYFNTGVLNNDMRSYFADGVTYGVPWFDDAVEKVYFAINQPDMHWVLGELHLRSGVITLYDSMLPVCILAGKAEDRPWWLDTQKQYAKVIPKYLQENDVMVKKGIDPNDYSITFRYATNVPQQGALLGDCGIWVMRNMFKLTKNQSLEIDSPTIVENATIAALAFRERLADLFWRYKIDV